MQRQTPRHNRWTSTSVATMFVLLSCSIGCVSWEHHVRRHSLPASIAEKKEGRYYHCPHCGQIVPREGFSKCPRCFQVPVYHGYEPTCWRQFPDGWGCPPESVTNNPEFWAQGMVESDAVYDELPAMNGGATIHSDSEADVNAENLDRPQPDDLPISPDTENQEVNLPQPAMEVAQSKPAPDQPEPAPHPSQPALNENAPSIAQPVRADDLAVNATATAPEASAPPKAEAVVSPKPMLDLPAEKVTQSKISDLATAESTVKPAPPKSTQHDPIDDVAEQPKSSTPAPSVASIVNQQSRHSTKQEPALSTKPIKDAPPATVRVFEAVTRIPVPTAKSSLHEFADLNAKQPSAPAELPNTEVTADSNEKPSLVRSKAKTIRVDTPSNEFDRSESENLAVATGSKVVPHDQDGPIPVRKVKLAKRATKVAAEEIAPPPSIAVSKEQHPAPVNRIALPRPSAPKTIDASHPLPVRRIELSELPTKIRR